MFLQSGGPPWARGDRVETRRQPLRWPATSWVKVKSFTVGDFAVVNGKRSPNGMPVALLATLGRDPAYVGNALVTLKPKERDRFWRSVETMGTPRARLAGLAKNKKRLGSARASSLVCGTSAARRSCGMPRCSHSSQRARPGRRRAATSARRTGGRRRLACVTFGQHPAPFSTEQIPPATTLPW